MENIRDRVDHAFEPETTVTKTVDIAGRDGLPMRVDVKNGRIIRIRPLHFDEKYSLEHIQPWKIEDSFFTLRSQ